MATRLSYRHHYILSDIIKFVGNTLRLSEITIGPISELLRRITLAQVFFVSGMLKLSDWNNALYLSTHEYPVSWLDPVAAAYMGAAIEMICPILLILGFMTRFAAFALLALTVVIQLSYQATNAQVFWIIILGWWIVSGAGRISIDFLLQDLKEAALPFVRTIGKFFAFLSGVIAPFYALFIRVWIAAVLFVAGHSAMGMDSLSIASYLHVLEYKPSESVLRMVHGGMSISPFVIFTTGIGAVCIAAGFGTRIFSLIALFTLLFATQHVDATAAQKTEFIYWIVLTSILFFNGPGKYSLDHIIRKKLSAYFPQLQGELPPGTDSLPHVVIVGAGFGGLATAKALRTTGCRVTLVDKHNYHLFQPLLYQIATCSLSPADIAVPIRSLFQDQKNIRVIMNEVEGIDKANKHIAFTDKTALAYDYLVLATGAQHSYFGKDEWSAFAPGMKKIEDALDVRAKILTAFELAENTDDPALREALMTFVIVGGGPTGVELAGALAELAYHGMRDEFRRINPKDAKIHLVEGSPRLLAVMPESLSAYTQRSLEKLGVKVATNARVELIDADGVVVAGKRITSKSVFWAAGVQASPAAKWLGAEADRAGRLKVLPDLSVPNCENVFAVGDTVSADVWNGKPMPGLAPAAKQSGAFVATQIRNHIEGRPLEKAFAYKHYGSLATIGRKSAVADFGAFKMFGPLAWWFWGAVHVMFLTNTRSRASVAIQWFWAYLTFKRSTRLITNTAKGLAK